MLGVGLVALIRLLPGAIASPFAGLLADRYPRRDVLVLASSAMALVLAGAAVAAALGRLDRRRLRLPRPVRDRLRRLRPGRGGAVPGAGADAAGALGQQRQPRGDGKRRLHRRRDRQRPPAHRDLDRHRLRGRRRGAAAGPRWRCSVVSRDRRPEYDEEEDVAGVLREVARGPAPCASTPALRLASLTLIVLLFFEGFADVILVTLALHLLTWRRAASASSTPPGGSAPWSAALGLALLLDRGQLVVAIAGGSLVIGAADDVAGFWPEQATAYLGWFGIGIGFTFVEVAAKTLMHRLGYDETMGRLISSLEVGTAGGDGAGLARRDLPGRSCSHPDGALIALGRADAGLRLRLLDPAARLRGRRPGRRGPLPAAARQLDLRAAADRHPRAAQQRPRRRSTRAGRRRGDRPGRGRRPLLPDRGGGGGGLRKRRVPPQRGPRRIVRRDRPAARRAAHGDGADDDRDPAAGARPRAVPLSPSPGTAAAKQQAHTVSEERWIVPG